MNAIVKTSSPSEIMETVLIKGDLSKLTAEERNNYYGAVCRSVGLNPLTKPFEFITLNGKLRLYALKDCTDQLRSLHKISVTDMTETEREGLSVVKTKVQNAEGRTDMAIGAVNISGLKGEALANALMKAETKSKRRATLSICGLGMLDETEVEDIPQAQKAAPAVHRVPSPSEVEQTEDGPVLLKAFRGEEPEAWAGRYIISIQTAKSVDEIVHWDAKNAKLLDAINTKHVGVYDKIEEAVKAKMALLEGGKPDPISSGPIKPEVKREGPDLARKYDDRCAWILEQIAAEEDPGALETFWDKQVEIDKVGYLKPDFDQFVEAYEKKHLELKGE